MSFITEGNIRRFKEMLAREADPLRRATIKRLLKEEQSKLRDADPDPAPLNVPGGTLNSAAIRERP